jgi:hypothetical protein
MSRIVALPEACGNQKGSCSIVSAIRNEGRIHQRVVVPWWFMRVFLRQMGSFTTKAQRHQEKRSPVKPA